MLNILFLEDNSLSTATFLPYTPHNIEYQQLTNTGAVPRGYKAKYESAEYWSNFMHIMDHGSNGPEAVSDKSEVIALVENGRLLIKGALENVTIL